MFTRLCVLLLLSAVPASAQTLFQGRIDVFVQDAQGAIVPGATVDIAGPVTQTQISDERGEAHFLNLPPGTYTVNSTLQGFRPYRNDRVTVDRLNNEAPAFAVASLDNYRVSCLHGTVYRLVRRRGGVDRFHARASYVRCRNRAGKQARNRSLIKCH